MFVFLFVFRINGFYNEFFGKDIACFCTVTIHPTNDTLLSIVIIGTSQKISKNKLYDVCIEAAGKIDTIELGMSVINNSGKLIFASHPDSTQKIRLDPHDLIKGKQIFGSWGGNSKPDKDIIKFYNLYKKNNLLKFLNSKVYSFKNIKKAIVDFRKGKTLRPVIKM